MGIYRRPRSPYWWLRVRRIGGHPIRESTGIPVDGGTPNQTRINRDRAQAAYAARAGDLARERYELPGPPVAVPTFREHLEWYEQHVSSLKRGHRAERYVLGRLAADLGHLPLNAMTREVILEYRAARAQNAAPGTVNRAMIILQSALGHAVPTWLASNPLVKLRALPEPRHAPAILSRQDERRLLAGMARPDRALILCALDTLLRLSDCVRLTVGQDHRTWLDVPMGKTGHHEVPVSTRLRAALDRLTPCELHGHYWPRWAHVDPPSLSPLIAKWLQARCQEAGIAYGRAIGGLTFHGFRHTGASRMIEAGVDLRTVQEIGGWHSLTQLIRYTHPTTSTLKRAVEAIGRSSGALRAHRRP